MVLNRGMRACLVLSSVAACLLAAAMFDLAGGNQFGNGSLDCDAA